MEYILSPIRVIYKIYYLIFFTVSLIILYPILFYYLSDPKRFPKAFKVMRFQAKMLLLFAGVRLNVIGSHNIPKTGAFIICPNHSSFLDIPCLYTIFQNYFVFTGKKEIEKWPLFHIYYTSGMNILVDRFSNTGSIKALKRMSQEIERHHPLMIFPEGTISNHVPKLAPFKSGAFALAIQKQIPILPMTFVTNWKRLQRSGLWKGKAGPGVSTVVIHKPVLTTTLNKDHIVELQNKVQAIINGPLSIY